MILLLSMELDAVLHHELDSNKFPVQLYAQHRIRRILWLTLHLQSSKIQERLTYVPVMLYQGLTE